MQTTVIPTTFHFRANVRVGGEHLRPPKQHSRRQWKYCRFGVHTLRYTLTDNRLVQGKEQVIKFSNIFFLPFLRFRNILLLSSASAALPLKVLLDRLFLQSLVDITLGFNSDFN